MFFLADRGMLLNSTFCTRILTCWHCGFQGCFLQLHAYTRGLLHFRLLTPLWRIFVWKSRIEVNVGRHFIVWRYGVLHNHIPAMSNAPRSAHHYAPWLTLGADMYTAESTPALALSKVLEVLDILIYLQYWPCHFKGSFLGLEVCRCCDSHLPRLRLPMGYDANARL